MNRSSALAVIAACVVAGVVSAVVGFAVVTGRAGPVGGPPEVSPSHSTASVTSLVPPTGTPPQTNKPTPAAPAAGPIQIDDLVQKADFAAAGWNTSNLSVQQWPGNGEATPSDCQQAEMTGLPGVRRVVNGRYQGAVVGATESALESTSAAEASAVAATLRTWATDCPTWTQTHGPAQVPVGARVELPLPGATAAWWPLEGTSVKGGLAIIVVGNRTAFLQVSDPDLKPSTMAAIIAGAAGRLG
jgi:hypothetical protein